MISSTDMAGWSLKRLAWAFGCSKKGSEDERRLGAALGERVWKGAVSPCGDVRLLVLPDGWSVVAASSDREDRVAYIAHEDGRSVEVFRDAKGLWVASDGGDVGVVLWAISNYGEDGST